MSRIHTIPLALFALAAMPLSSASADNRITDASVHLSEDAWELRLEAQETLGEPRVHTSRGFVRVWFPQMRAARFDEAGDGGAVRSVRVRAGVQDSAVSIIRIGDQRRIAESAVQVMRDGSIARVRIARSDLPLVRTVPTRPAREASAQSEAEPAAATDAEEESPAPAEEVVLASPALALTQTGAEAALLTEGSGLSTTMLLVLLTALLGLAYLLVRLFGKRRRGVPPPAIEIVANKRLGARHQILVVRALGEDHLLTVHGGRTERIASMPAPAGGDPSGGSEEDLLPFLRLGDKEALGQAQTLHRAARNPGESERPRFGAELMKLVAERTRADQVAVARTAPPSEAVAGLLRLREKLGR